MGNIRSAAWRVPTLALSVSMLTITGSAAAQRSSADLAVLPPTPATTSGNLVFAQDQGDQRTLCEGPEDNRPADAAIEACTALIRSSDQTSETLSVAFERRGFAYLTRAGEVQSRGRSDPEDVDLAIADFDEAIRLNPDFEHAYFLLGNAKYNKQDYDRAIVDYTQAIQLNPNDMMALNNLATIHMVRQDYDGAIKIYGEALRIEPRYAIAFNNRGLAYYYKGDNGSAIADFDQAIRLEPKYITALFDRGLAHDKIHDIDRAIADYQDAIRIKADIAEVHQKLGDDFDDKGEYDRSIAEFDEAIRLQSDNPDYLNSRCWARALANRDLNLARMDCDAALSLAPGSPYILDSRALVSLKQQRWQDAWNDYDAADRMRPDHANYLFGRGVAALRLGRASQGQADISKAIQIDGTIAETFLGYGITP